MRWSFALALVAMLALHFATANGIGLNHDSAFYLSARRTGLLTRSTWWPPAYPALLALAEYLGVNTQVGARWLNGVLFAGIVALVTAAAYLSTGRRYALVASGWLALVSPALWFTCPVAATEPLCIFLGFAALVLLQLPTSGSRNSLALDCLALANLTRYAALAYTGAAWLAWLPRHGFKKASLLAAAAVLPLLLWVLVHRLAGNPSPRTLGFHPPPVSEMVDAVLTLRLWLLPVQASWPEVLAGLLVGALLARYSQPAPRANAQIHLYFILAYAPQVLLSRTLADENLALDQRMLCVLWPSAATLVVTGWARTRARLELFVPLCVCLVVIGVSTTRSTFGRAFQLRAESVGFAAPEWRQSPLVQSVQDLPWGTVLFTNEPAPFLLHARLNPLWFDQSPDRPDYRTWLEWGRKELTADGGYYAYLAAPMPQRPPLKDLAPLLGWRVVRSCPQGTLYFVPKAGSR